MYDRQQQGKSTVRRLLLIGASLGVGTFGWLLLGQSEALRAAEASKGDALARIGSEVITEAQVTENAAGELLQVERQRYELIERAVRDEVRERLISLEAKKRGIDEEALMKAEVEDKVAEVTDGEVDAFYEARKSQIRATKEQAAGQIRNYLLQQRQARVMEEFISGLEANYKVEYLMDPFRVEVMGDGPRKGPDNAPVQIVEFSDFECPFCSRVNPTLQQVQEKYGDKVAIEFRQFPLAIHRNAKKAGEASLCANDQGKFWAMHDAMFADQKNLTVDGLKGIAASIELDTAAFNTCLDSGKYGDQVDADMAEGSRAGVTGTPAFFVNGRFISGAVPFDSFAEVIDDELSRKGAAGN